MYLFGAALLGSLALSLLGTPELHECKEQELLYIALMHRDSSRSTAESVRWGFVRLHSQTSGTEGVEPSTGDGKTKIVRKTVGLHSAMCHVDRAADKTTVCSIRS